MNVDSATNKPGRFEDQHDASAEPRGFKRILVGVDGSAQSDFAVEAAARLAQQVGAEVVLVHVFCIQCGSSPELGYAEQEMRSRALLEGEALLNLAKAEMPEPKHVECVLREGDPIEEIIAAAALYNADVIVIGTHGRGRVVQAFIGSVANAIARKAPCPVMTVAHAPRTNAAAPARNQEAREGVLSH